MMDDEHTMLAKLTDATRLLSECRTIKEVQDARNMAEALRHYAKVKGMSAEASNYATELRLRAERKLGEMLEQTIHLGRPPLEENGTDGGTFFGHTTLAELGVSKKESAFAQTIARMPVDEFESHIVQTKADGRELTAFGLFRLAKRCELAATADTPPFPSTSYRCLVIDPPWPVEKIIREVRTVQSWALDYATMSLQEIEALPIATLAEPDGCHVYLWVTHHFLPAGLQLFEAWGIRYQCQLTWVKNVGITPFSWMYDTEHVLFGRIGHLDLLQNGLRLSFSEAVQGHSVKPDVFYERVCEASPGPRLEMFARAAHEGFQSWGAEAPIR